jgi:DsbC/DsbD-like thiol-disulfide interchange protein
MTRPGMRGAGRIAAVGMLLAGCGRAPQTPVQTAVERAAPSQAVLLFERAHLTPDVSMSLGVHITLVPGWHTYTDPPGDSGMAPILSLELPEGIVVGPLEYPPAKPFTDAAGTTYGFDGSVLLRAPLHVTDPGSLPERVAVNGTLDYLICRDVCIPQRAVLEGELVVREEASPVTDAWRRAAAAGGWDSEGNDEYRTGGHDAVL